MTETDTEPDEVPSTDETAPIRSRARRRRRILFVVAAVGAVLALFLSITAFTGLEAPGMLQRYPYGDLHTLADRVNADAGPFRTPDDCWRLLDDKDGPLRSIAAVDYLRSRVVVRAYAAQSGVIDASTFNSIADGVDKIIAADPSLSWGMVEIEPSPDGWSPLVSCSLVTRGF